MKIKTLIFIFISTMLFACTEEEKQLIQTLDKLSASKKTLLNSSELSSMSINALSLLKIYSDLLLKTSKQLPLLVSDKRTAKKIGEHLLANEGLSTVCSEYLLDFETYSNLNKQCQLGFFDVCPVSFANFQYAKEKIISSLKIVLKNEYANSDCSNY